MFDRRPARALLPACALLALAPRTVRADDFLDYKYSDYSEEDGRMRIITQSALVQQDLGTDTQLRLTGVHDAIAGASPTGVPFAVAQSIHTGWTEPVTDERKAWNGDVIQQAGPVSIDLGFANSREEDYLSYGWSVNTVTDFNEKNTSLLLGAAGTDDDVEAPLLGFIWARKHSNSAALGVTQLLGPNTSVTLNLTWKRMTGFLDEPYKEVEKGIVIFPGIPPLPEIFPENRPNWRNKATVFLELNQAVPAAHAAIDASYRFYGDTYGIEANDLELQWLQHLGRALVLTPSARVYQQSAAKFYYYDLNGTGLVPTTHPDGNGPYYSSDYRLSQLATRDFGIKAVWDATSWLQLNLAYDDYRMWGTDGITPEMYYPHARITTAGARVSW